jgi:FkbM family methyltransferase
MSFYRPPPTCQIPEIGEKYEELFGCRSMGTFVEVGAYDGVSFSNTSFLADLGWRGIYFEPVPEFAALCALRHIGNHVAVMPYAVGARPAQVDLHLGGTLTTTSARQVEVYNQIPWAQGNHIGAVISVPQLRLDFALDLAKYPHDFDLLVVDVEGAEAAVFEGLDSRWRPRVMIVEIEDEHPDLAKFEDVRERAVALRQTIASRGYKEFYRDAINTIFTRAT